MNKPDLSMRAFPVTGGHIDRHFDEDEDRTGTTERFYVEEEQNSGMLLLDYFAAKALTGILVAHPRIGYLDAAKIAYSIAESMLIMREQTLKSE